MFKVHYKDGKVYLVFPDSESMWHFYESEQLSPRRCTIVSFRQYENAIEFVPIIEAPQQAHEAALARGKEWDHDS